MIHDVTHHKRPAMIIWPEHPEDGVAEPAIYLQKYTDGLIGIKQGKSELLITAGGVPELVKALRKIDAEEAE